MVCFSFIDRQRFRNRKVDVHSRNAQVRQFIRVILTKKVFLADQGRERSQDKKYEYRR